MNDELRVTKYDLSCLYDHKTLILHITSILLRMQQINRLKVILVERQKTGKWLAETLGKNEATVSRWCTNESQPSLITLVQIAKALDVNITDLLISTK